MSVLKSGYTVDDSNLNSDVTAEKQDVQQIADDVETKLQNGYVSVSSTDLYLKRLIEAVQGVANNFAVTKINTGADEALQLNLDAAGITSGYVPVANGSDAWTWAAQGGGGAVPVDVTVTAGEDLDERDVVYLNTSDNKFYKADIDADPIKISSFRGVVNETGGIAADATGTVRILGEVSGYTGLTAWQEVYIDSTPGGITQTKPSPEDGGDQVIQARVGIAVSTSAILVDSRSTPLQFMKRESLADDATLTIKHYSDVLGRARRMRAFMTNNLAGSTLPGATYAAVNMDSNVALEQLTYTADQCSGGSSVSSSNETGFGKDNAFDNSNSTEWFPAVGLTASYIGYTFASPKSIRRYTITAEDSGTFLTSCPKDFALEYWNGSSWVPVDSQTNITGWTTSQKRTFTPAPHAASSTQWRIYITANNGHASYMGNAAEIEMMEVAGSKERLAQSFQIASNGNAAAIKLYLRKVGSPAGNMTLRIETDNAGSPSGTLVDANATTDPGGNVDESTLPTSYDWVTFTLPGNVALSSGVTYWLVLSTDRAASETNYVDWGADGSPGYTDGQMLQYNGSSWNTESKDAVFDVIGPGTSFDTMPLIASWGSGLGEAEVVMGDGAYANLDTQSTLKNTTGGDADLVFIVELE